VKLLVYGLLMWLPFYMVKYLHIEGYEQGVLVSLFGIGGVIGSIIIGIIIDLVSRRVLVEVALLLLTIPVLISFRLITPETYTLYYIIIPIAGFLLNSVSNVVTSVAPAEISDQESKRSSRVVVATVVGVIDGAGGIGAALGQPIVLFN
jgi:OPA family glycerol-3-phosphate transporter-like MFS transporter 1/2